MTPAVPIKKWHVYIANLNPRHKSEPGKIRPVVVIQTDLINTVHPSTIVCPLTTNVKKNVQYLRVHVKKKEAGLTIASDVLVDQMRAIDNTRFQKKLGKLHKATMAKLSEAIRVLLD
ncbi:type II toxin-antitoxin system PemK/MazF family toxin [bacterium]|nr:type II toxin-antitoxin system PemK/MazF family toxin [bacterium]